MEKQTEFEQIVRSGIPIRFSMNQMSRPIPLSAMGTTSIGTEAELTRIGNQRNQQLCRNTEQKHHHSRIQLKSAVVNV